MLYRWALLTVLLLACATTPALAKSGVVFESPELVVVRTDMTESCMMPGGGYEGFELDGDSASWLISGINLPPGSEMFRAGGISRIAWAPEGDHTRVEVQFAAEPASSLINSLAGTELRPQTPQVVVGFGFSELLGKSRRSSLLGHRNARNKNDTSDQFGSYELPRMPEARYSDALVTPSRSGSAAAGCNPSLINRSFSSRNLHHSTCSPSMKVESPTSVIWILFSIWRTMVSMCLSLIRTPCRR